MGNTEISESDANEEAVAIYSKLINMSFDESISLKAAIKYPKNLNKAIDYVTKRTQKKIESHEETDLKEDYVFISHFNNICTQQINQCPHVEYLVNTLLKFDEIKSTLNATNNIQTKTLSEQIFVSPSQFHKIRLMKHFIHVQKHHNETKIDRQYYQNILENCKYDKTLICLTESRHVNRQHDFSQYNMIRSRNQSNNHQQHNTDNVRDITLIQLLDTIHCSLLHQTLSNSSKFITNINNEKYQKSMLSNNMLQWVGLGKANEYENLPMYQFGSAFNVKPKFSNFKDEFMNNSLYQLNVQQYECLLQKAVDFIDCHKSDFIFVVREYKNESNLHYGDKMSMDHIICVMGYCNEDEMQRQYKNAFRPLSKDTNQNDIRIRQSEIAIWMKLLFEAVSLFGNTFKFNEKVYHGLSCKLKFEFMGNTFSIPTSTSMSYAVAERFATNAGIVLELTRTTQHSENNLYLDVYSKYMFTDYPWEQERLVFGAALGFSNIMYYDKFSKLFHDDEIKSLYLYQQIINGKHFSHRNDIFKDKYQENIIRYTIGLWDNNKRNDIDGYIFCLFKVMTEKIKTFRFLKDEFYKLSNDLQEILSMNENIVVPPVITLEVKTKDLLHPSLFTDGRFKSKVCQYEYTTSVLIGQKLKIQRTNKWAHMFKNLTGDDSETNIYEEQSRKVGIYFVLFKSYDQVERKTYVNVSVGIETLPKLVDFIHITVSVWIEQLQFELFLSQQLSKERLYWQSRIFEANRMNNIASLKVDMAIQDIKVDGREDTAYFPHKICAGPPRLFRLF